MKTERAIELLNRISDSQFDGQHGDERREALEMAVRALFSQQIVNDSQGLVNDCISRKMAIGALNDEYHGMISDESMKIYQIINWISALPSAQPERKKGRWLPDNNCYYEIRYMCSECKLPFHVETIMMKPSWRFCPNCGAIMDGESDENN